MKLTAKNISLGLLVLLPQTSFAQLVGGSDAGPLQDMLLNIMVFIDDTLIPFIIALGFLAFVWGMFKYFILGGADEEKRAQGRSLMIYAVIGFVAIIIFFGVINMIASSLGLEGENIDYLPGIPTR